LVKPGRLEEVKVGVEIGILKRLQHPHIVAMFSLVEEPVHFYLIRSWSNAWTSALAPHLVGNSIVYIIGNQLLTICDS
jgi:hypothetical protein